MLHAHLCDIHILLLPPLPKGCNQNKKLHQTPSPRFPMFYLQSSTHSRSDKLLGHIRVIHPSYLLVSIRLIACVHPSYCLCPSTTRPPFAGGTVSRDLETPSLRTGAHACRLHAHVLWLLLAVSVSVSAPVRPCPFLSLADCLWPIGRLYRERRCDQYNLHTHD